MTQLLVVEDDADLSSLIEDLLVARGYAVRMARDGEQGLASLKDGYPDLVIMDVEMPRLTGPDMAERMFVEDLGRENIPIVLVSGSRDLPNTAERIGTPYYLAKPFSMRSYLELIERALRDREIPRPPVEARD